MAASSVQSLQSWSVMVAGKASVQSTFASAKTAESVSAQLQWKDAATEITPTIRPRFRRPGKLCGIKCYESKRKSDRSFKRPRRLHEAV
jgi:hypothetical protein